MSRIASRIATSLAFALAILAGAPAPTGQAQSGPGCETLLGALNGALARQDLEGLFEAAGPILEGGCPLDTRIETQSLLARIALIVAQNQRAAGVPLADEAAFLTTARERGASSWRLLMRMAEAYLGSPERSPHFDPGKTLVYVIEAQFAAEDPLRTPEADRPTPADLNRLQRMNDRAYILIRDGDTAVDCTDPDGLCQPARPCVAERAVPVLFATNRWDLSEQALRDVDRLARILRRDGVGGGCVDTQSAGQRSTTRGVCIVGHADPTGSDTHNDALSANRAQAVAAALVGSGFPREAVRRVIGMGERRPLAIDEPERFTQPDLYRLLRRVEVVPFEEETQRCRGY